uniref:Uncharacterized protein n=1 Tax=Ciona intestinalis TaxID=7719 RepID=H2XNX4_CIOIN
MANTMQNTSIRYCTNNLNQISHLKCGSVTWQELHTHLINKATG